MIAMNAEIESLKRREEDRYDESSLQPRMTSQMETRIEKCEYMKLERIMLGSAQDKSARYIDLENKNGLSVVCRPEKQRVDSIHRWRWLLQPTAQCRLQAHSYSTILYIFQD